MNDHADDSVLVMRAQQGDQQAFTWLVIRYQYKIAALLARYLASKDVPDITQETFIKAYRSLATFRFESTFYTWLYRIAINTAKNHWTAQGRRLPIDTTDRVSSEEDGDKLHEAANPERILLSEELQEAILQAIGALPEELRLAITLREIEGFSYEQIANVMSCPIGTVRSRIFRAREAIDKKIKPLLSF